MDVIGELRGLVAEYAEVTSDWSELNDSDDDEVPTVSECEAYSERLEGLAHEFAAVAGRLLAEVDGEWKLTFVAGNVEPEPLGPPDPAGVELPD